MKSDWRRTVKKRPPQFLPEQTDLLLLDLNLPCQSGWDVFERLTTRYPLVPVIIITGMPNQYSDRRGCGRECADGEAH